LRDQLHTYSIIRIKLCRICPKFFLNIVLILAKITVVVSGASDTEVRHAAGLDDPQAWVAAVRLAEDRGATRKEAIAEVARRAGIPKREVYDAVVKSSAPRK